MRISTPSSRSAAVLLAVSIASAALAQDSARERAQKEGDVVMERLKGAVSRQKAQSSEVPSPHLPPAPTEAERRRAFEGLRARKAMPVIDARAKAALEASEARMAAEREAQAKRLRQAFGLEPSEEKALAKAAPAPAAKAWVPVLFVSSSMPIPVLRTYAAQLERVHGVLAFRGMLGGLHKVGPMAKLSAQILRIDPGCEGPACAMRNVQLIVDPIVFRQHGVGRVPALAMIPGDPTEAYCERDDESPRATHVVYGDSALAGLFEEYARLGGQAEVRDAQALLGSR
ncbi:type-F conjugative transfer system pilin assembly protein TrbC [Sphingobium sp. H39-3-25]|uniref:type-F conjugative transfer system pilin assembly protein TrbC n=1 Tax=Sphingomonadales TaxID=204457 RepID=UPI000835325F|nr:MULTISPECIES: type-F conjugative transfer system pilin assembly protein TrbC [Sphingomonadaceae]MDF0491109.1 type-F conjugative transfer system pilin assembly protein TrbC [Sphingomonas pollutisoli]MDF0545160.1 type-F conjugative transfer system pilin assembly protein TrbC [Sphingobium arseniciresistens]